MQSAPFRTPDAQSFFVLADVSVRSPGNLCVFTFFITLYVGPKYVTNISFSFENTITANAHLSSGLTKRFYEALSLNTYHANAINRLQIVHKHSCTSSLLCLSLASVFSDLVRVHFTACLFTMPKIYHGIGILPQARPL